MVGSPCTLYGLIGADVPAISPVTSRNGRKRLKGTSVPGRRLGRRGPKANSPIQSSVYLPQNRAAVAPSRARAR